MRYRLRISGVKQVKAENSAIAGNLLTKSVSLAANILILRECVWNAPMVSLVLLAFDDAGSLGSPPHQVVYLPG